MIDYPKFHDRLLMVLYKVQRITFKKQLTTAEGTRAQLDTLIFLYIALPLFCSFSIRHTYGERRRNRFLKMENRYARNVLKSREFY